jgi:hypothetical protein
MGGKVIEWAHGLVEYSDNRMGISYYWDGG